MTYNAVSQIPAIKTVHVAGDKPITASRCNFYALVGVVTNKYRYVKMKYNAASQIPASKTVHVVGDNSNNGESYNSEIDPPVGGRNPKFTSLSVSPDKLHPVSLA